MPVDSAPLIYTLIGVIVMMGVWVFIDTRSEMKKKMADHEVRLESLENERTDFALLRQRVEYIADAVDELRHKPMRRGT